LLLLNILLGVLFITGNVCVTEAFRVSSAQLIGVIIPSFPAFVLLLAAVFFHDKITLPQTCIIIVILFGITLLSINFKKLKNSGKLFDKGVAFALTGTFFFSLFFTFSRILIDAYGWFLPTFIAIACFPFTLVLFKKQKEKFIIPKEPGVLFAMFMVAFLIRCGDFAFNYGLSLPNANGIVAPIANAAPALFVTASSFIFKDKLTKQEILGIIVTLFGIVLLTTFG